MIPNEHITFCSEERMTNYECNVNCFDDGTGSNCACRYCKEEGSGRFDTMELSEIEIDPHCQNAHYNSQNELSQRHKKCFKKRSDHKETVIGFQDVLDSDKDDYLGVRNEKSSDWFPRENFIKDKKSNEITVLKNGIWFFQGEEGPEEHNQAYYFLRSLFFLFIVGIFIFTVKKCIRKWKEAT